MKRLRLRINPPEGGFERAQGVAVERDSDLSAGYFIKKIDEVVKIVRCIYTD